MPVLSDHFCERCGTEFPARKGRGSYPRWCLSCAPDRNAYVRLYRIERSRRGFNARGKPYARRGTS